MDATDQAPAGADLSTATLPPTALRARIQQVLDETEAQLDRDLTAERAEVLKDARALALSLAERVLEIDLDAAGVAIETSLTRGVPFSCEASAQFTVEGLTFRTTTSSRDPYSRVLYLARRCEVSACQYPYSPVLDEVGNLGEVGVALESRAQHGTTDFEDGPCTVDPDAPKPEPEPSVTQQARNKIDDIGEAARRVREATDEITHAQAECDMIVAEGLPTLIGVPNPLTGKPHSATSAEDAIKGGARYHRAKERKLDAEGDLILARAWYDQAKLRAKLAVALVGRED